MAENEDNSLLREIDEELRQEKAAGLAKQYGMYVVAAAVLLVAGVGGYKALQGYQADTRLAATDSYVSASTTADLSDDGSAIAAFDDVVETDVGEIDDLARMRRASELAEAGDSEGAISAYQAIVGNAAVNADLWALASVNLATLLLNQGDAEGARTAVAPLTGDSSGWHYAALEINALAALDSGDTPTARQNLEQITTSNNAPSALRTRASTLLGTLPDGDNG